MRKRKWKRNKHIKRPREHQRNECGKENERGKRKKEQDTKIDAKIWTNK